MVGQLNHNESYRRPCSKLPACSKLSPFTLFSASSPTLKNAASPDCVYVACSYVALLEQWESPLNVEVAYKKGGGYTFTFTYKKGGGYTFTENTEQDGRLMYLLAKKLNMFLGIYSVVNDTDLYTNIHTSNTNTTEEKLYKFRALEGESGRDKSRKEEVQFSGLLSINEPFLSLKKNNTKC